MIDNHLSLPQVSPSVCIGQNIDVAVVVWGAGWGVVARSVVWGAVWGVVVVVVVVDVVARAVD